MAAVVRPDTLFASWDVGSGPGAFFRPARAVSAIVRRQQHAGLRPDYPCPVLSPAAAANDQTTAEAAGGDDSKEPAPPPPLRLFS